MASPLDPAASSVLIVGAGTWGSSTALHLARRGYKRVTVLDPYPVPSAISAGNDVNKIVEQGVPLGPLHPLLLFPHTDAGNATQGLFQASRTARPMSAIPSSMKPLRAGSPTPSSRLTTMAPATSLQRATLPSSRPLTSARRPLPKTVLSSSTPPKSSAEPCPRVS